MAKVTKPEPINENDIEALLSQSGRESFDELAQLNEELETLDTENREQYEMQKAKYEALQADLIALLKTSDKKDKGRIVAIKRAVDSRKQAFDAHYSTFAKEDADAKKAEKERAKLEAKEKQLLDQLETNANISEDEKADFRHQYRDLPDYLKSGCLDRLKGNLNDPDSVSCLTGFRATLFELSRRTTAVTQGLETFEDFNEPIYLDYDGYQEGDNYMRAPFRNIESNEKKPHKKGTTPESDIQMDVHGIMRDGKPYVYETKAYPRKMAGHEYGGGEAITMRNQLLKYKEAIEKDLISGATVEISGRVDYDLLRWAVGEQIQDEGMVPNVEILYTIDLPSGREYRFALKKGKAQRLRFENENDSYTSADKVVIRGIAQAVRDKSISSLIQDVNIDLSRIGDEVPQEAVDAPEKITDLDTFHAYCRARRESMWRQLKGKALNPPKIDKVPAYDERATPEFVHEMIMALQRTLEADPALRELQKAYVLQPDQIDGVVEKAMQEIEKVMDYEVERQVEEAEEEGIHEHRVKMGYPKNAPHLGYPLDIEHIVMDTIQDVTKVGEEQRARSYSNPERFINARDLMTRLEERDRTFIETRIFDPVSDKQSTSVITGKKAERKDDLLKEHEKNLMLENLRRAEKKLQGLLKRYNKLHEVGLANLDEKERIEYGKLQSSLSVYNDNMSNGLKSELEQAQADVAAFDKRKAETLNPLKKAMGQFRQKIAKAVDKEAVQREREASIAAMREASAEFEAESIELKAKSLGVYQQIFAKEWDSFALREVGREDANLIKLIYVVTPEGVVRIDEERIRGGADSSRAAHSELGQCRNIYAAGEMAFIKRDGKWVLKEINNGSGHYRPLHDTLPYALNVVAEQLNLSEKEKAQVELPHCLFREIDIDGLAF